MAPQPVEALLFDMGGVVLDINFDTCLYPRKIGLRKPDADAFQYISQYTGTALQNILFFDDTLENIEGAKRAGLQTVLVESTQ